jgi:hypothetical protein
MRKNNSDILIISRDGDSMTDAVIEWLYSGKIKYHRINIENIDEIKFTQMKINNMFWGSKHEKKQYGAVWFRFNAQNKFINESISDENLNQHLDMEMKSFKINLYNFLYKNSYNSIGYCNNGNFSITDKINSLQIAAEIGLKIPNTLITNNSKNISTFKERHKEVIIKPISEMVIFKNENIYYGLYTEDLKSDYTDNMRIFPTLIQKKQDKKFDVRIFYLNEKFYAAAILSHDKVDYRNQDVNSKNRIVPINLPLKIKKKIIKFMFLKKMNIGVIDMIYTKNDKWVFLEVNPSGIFDDISAMCNYHLPEKIALDLCEKI